MFKRALALVLMLATLASSCAILSSCSKEDEGKTVNAYYVSSLYDFDPSLAIVDDDAMDVFNLVYEPLFYLKDNGKVEGLLAEEYEIDKEANTLTITLRDTYWSDGIAVKNEDVLFAWQRILDPNMKNPAATMLYEIKNATNIKRGEDAEGNTVTISDIGIEIRGDKVLIITFENKDVDYDAFLRNLTSVALTPLREDVVAQRDAYWSKRKATVVTNGPFNFGYIDYDTGTFSLIRNKYYNRSMEDTSRIMKYVTPYAVKTLWYTNDSEYSWAETNSSAFGVRTADKMDSFAKSIALWLDRKLKEFEENTIFYVGELSLEARKAYKDSKLLTINDAMSTYSYVINCEKFSKEVRKAMSSVIDREYIVNEITTFGKAATGFISYGLMEGTKRNKDFRENGDNLIKTTVSDEDISAATKAVSAAKSNGLDANIVIKCKAAEEDIMVAKYVAEQWNKIGFSARIQVLSWSEGLADEGGDDPIKYHQYDLQTAYINGDYDVIAIDYQMLSTDPISVLLGFSSTLNGFGCDFSIDPATNISKDEIRAHSSGYVSNEYDLLIRKAYNEKNLDLRAAMLHEAEALLLEDMPVIPLYFNQNFYLKSKKLKNVDTNYYNLPIFTKAKLKAKVETNNQEEDEEA